MLNFAVVITTYCLWGLNNRTVTHSLGSQVVTENILLLSLSLAHDLPQKYFFFFAESDGKEFEDDPLLQVLRKQRTWVKEQIR